MRVLAVVVVGVAIPGLTLGLVLIAVLLQLALGSADPYTAGFGPRL